MAAVACSKYIQNLRNANMLESEQYRTFSLARMHLLLQHIKSRILVFLLLFYSRIKVFGGPTIRQSYRLNREGLVLSP
jgi:hypothetical protein